MKHAASKKYGSKQQVCCTFYIGKTLVTPTPCTTRFAPTRKFLYVCSILGWSCPLPLKKWQSFAAVNDAAVVVTKTRHLTRHLPLHCATRKHRQHPTSRRGPEAHCSSPILKNMHFCDVHCSSGKKQIPKNAHLKEHAFWVDPFFYTVFVC